MRVNSVFKVTLVYLIFGLLWILLSDKLLSLWMADDVLAMAKVQTIKGCFYVVLTAALLYVLIRRYNSELNDKVAKLQKSDERYRLLFDSSPSPGFIYDPQTQQILKVNNAALKYYGYTEEEFSHMSILTIEDEETIDLSSLEEKLNIPKDEEMEHIHGIHRHKKKDGKNTFVYMQGSVVIYKGVPAYIVIVTDITHQLKYIDTVEQQNEKLNRIAWLQSHVVRAPLASLMGLVHLLKDENQDRNDLVEKVLNAADTLDDVIREISESSIDMLLPSRQDSVTTIVE